MKLVRQCFGERTVRLSTGKIKVLTKHNFDLVSYDEGVTWGFEPLAELRTRKPDFTPINSETSAVYYLDPEVMNRPTNFGINDRDVV